MNDREYRPCYIDVWRCANDAAPGHIACYEHGGFDTSMEQTIFTRDRYTRLPRPYTRLPRPYTSP